MIADQAAARRRLGDAAACATHREPVSTVGWAPGNIVDRQWWVIIYACGCARLRGDRDAHGRVRTLPA